MQELTAAAIFLKQYSVALMFIVFAMLMATIFWPGRRERFERDAQIPLQDDR